jgi:hypothetical protein
MTFGAREGRHDDLVLSMALAVWLAKQDDNELDIESLNI